MNDRAFINLWLRLALLVLSAFGVQIATAQGVEVLGETDSTRLVRHAAGETRVPLNPQRIAALNMPLLDMLVSLEIQPVAAATVDEGGFPLYLAPQLGGTLPLGGDEQPNTEAMIAVEPDLILADPYEQHYEWASKIAPTAVINVWTDWRQALLDIGKLVGREDLARAKLEAYASRVAEQRERLATALGDQTVAIVRLTYDGRTIGLEANLGFTENFFVDLALNPAPLVREVAWDQPGFQSISLEKIPELGADHIFLVVPPFADAEAAAERLVNDPLWQNVRAVQQGNVYTVPYRVWACIGLICNSLANAQAVEHLTGQRD